MSEKNMTIQDLSDKLDRIAKYAIIAAKDILDIKEASVYTGLSLKYIYRLTSNREIPHFKRTKKLYFVKSELNKWMLSCKVLTKEEIDKAAETYVVTH